MRIAIVGAGMAGLSCAVELSRRGAEVAVFDKGRGAGGRMSSRRTPTCAGEASFDHGAQYFTVRDPDFQAQVDRWASAGVVAPWPAAGEAAWVGAPAMNAPLKVLAGLTPVRWNAKATALSRGAQGWRLQGEGCELGTFAAVVVAVPAEQAADLLQTAAPAWSAHARAAPSAPCWTTMAAFADRLGVAADVMRAEGAIGWAARNSAKPDRAGPEAWVIQASPEWSADNLEREAEAVAADLLDAFWALSRLRPVPTLALAAHRWRYARSRATGDGALWDAGARLGVCGDWLLGPRVESAWLSGRRLAALIVPTPALAQPGSPAAPPLESSPGADRA